MLKNHDKRRSPYTIRRDGEGYRSVLLADPYNSRMKLMSHAGSTRLSAEALLKGAKSLGYGKAIAYIRNEERPAFQEAFVEEGKIPGFFNGVDAYCMSAYLDSTRKKPRDSEKADKIISMALAKEKAAGKINPNFSFRRATAADSMSLAKLYYSVFGDSYPTPLSDPGFVQEAMESGTVFWLAMDGDTLCGAASLDTDREMRNAEVTDCAVDPAYRGQGLLADLVVQLEDVGKELGLSCLYSLSRALLPGINIVLSAAGYEYYGRLVNNCRICGGYEDMNIWQKFISG
ncbi:putative beta-lysine N-acetyltransferase [Dethiobacter alkaliphilus]|uniref:putative beta-lysine N-acetyltransferase n=1 Tax=Dethiobacter alkaliphilus TaxID=427926 RepID=UPI0022262ACE|nr:putative beta-lysine N-acetyltransferase [Dethiobacter alkaliphilus]MCW3489074.1 putative beta-lysine N-acetyltransferase [Dethiobacter alkaliphilus]